MSNLSQKTTIYLQPTVKKFLQHRAVSEGRSLSEIINDEFLDMLEDLQDLKTVQHRRGEETVAFDAVLRDLGLSRDDVRN